MAFSRERRELIHDPSLLDRLAALPAESFAGEVFRATRRSHDPLAPSTRGGRWARDGGSSVLYTSLERDGALAEIGFHWGQLTPLPTKPALLHRLTVTARNARRLLRASLPLFGVDPTRFGELNYARTQEIGEGAAFLGYDGFIVPSARWSCENLILFGGNHEPDNELSLISSEEVDWLKWARANEVVRS